MTRREERTYGNYGYSVRFWLEDGRACCEWRDRDKKRHQKSWPAEKAADAREWAIAYAAERAKLRRIEGPIPTVAELWDTYRSADSPTWRPKTRKVYADWVRSLAPAFLATVDKITHADVDAYRDAQRARGVAHGTIQRAVNFLRQMLNFAVGRQSLFTNPIATYRYKVPKDERLDPPAEYTRDEVRKILAVLDWPKQWRPRSVIRLCASYGARVNAILHLRWDDVNMDAGEVTFQGKWDKTGETFTRPMTRSAREALLECLNHRRGEWVFWSPRKPEQPISYSGLHWHLMKAEERAGIEHIDRRAFHGERRMVIGDLGDLETGAQWVNQKDIAVTQSYQRNRSSKVDEARLRIERREASGE